MQYRKRRRDKPILKEQNLQECVNKGLRHEEKKLLKKQ